MDHCSLLFILKQQFQTMFSYCLVKIFHKQLSLFRDLAAVTVVFYLLRSKSKHKPNVYTIKEVEKGKTSILCSLYVGQ